MTRLPPYRSPSQPDQEGDRDAVHGGGAHPEVPADGGQGDVDDRRVQDGHEHRGDEDRTDRYLLADPRGHGFLSPRQRLASGFGTPAVTRSPAHRKIPGE